MTMDEFEAVRLVDLSWGCPRRDCAAQMNVAMGLRWEYL